MRRGRHSLVEQATLDSGGSGLRELVVNRYRLVYLLLPNNKPSRLAREETFGQPRASRRLKAWLRDKRSDVARHWNLLTDLKVEHLPYAT